MGNFIVFKPSVADAYRSYARMPLAHVQKKLINKYFDMQFSGKIKPPAHMYPSSSSSSSSSSSKAPPPTSSNFGYEVDFSCFHALFPSLTAADAASQFRLWDSNEDGLVDLLEIFAACILLSLGKFESKISALFHLFDFDDSGGLEVEEWHLLVFRVSAAWARTLGTERGKEWAEEEMQEVANRGMMILASIPPTPVGRLRPESQVSLPSLLMYAGVVHGVALTLSRHNTTDGETLREFWSNVLAKKPVDLTGRLKNSTESALTFRAEALRIYTAFKTWTPLHRQMLQWEEQHESKIQAEVNASNIAMALAANAAHQAANQPMGAASTAAAAAIAAKRNKNQPPSSTAAQAPPHGQVDSPDVSPRSGLPAVSPSVDDAPSKLQSHTVSSLAKDKRLQEGLLFLPRSTEKMLGEKSSKDVMEQTLRMLDIKEAGLVGTVHGGAGGAGAAASSSSATGLDPSAMLLSAANIKARALAREKDHDDVNLRHRPAYLAIKRIKAKVQSRRSKNDPALQHFIYDHTTLKQAKNLFDSLDKDGSGEISISELTGSLEGNPHLGAAISAFRSLDVDQTGSIDFHELLRAIFPLASNHHVKMMCSEVRALEITKKDMDYLQRAFEWCDEDFDGRVLFSEYVAYLRDKKTDPTGKRKDYARDYTPTRAIYELNDPRLMQFHECMHELFAKSHAHMLREIDHWASLLPVLALTDKQHVELEQLFELYDADGSGSIDMDELVEHFTNLGFNEEDNERMFRMFDRDGGGSVDLVEFKRFYRSVYDSTRVEDYGRGVTTHSAAHGEQ